VQTREKIEKLNLVSFRGHADSLIDNIRALPVAAATCAAVSPVSAFWKSHCGALSAKNCMTSVGGQRLIRVPPILPSKEHFIETHLLCPGKQPGVECSEGRPQCCHSPSLRWASSCRRSPCFSLRPRSLVLPVSVHDTSVKLRQPSTCNSTTSSRSNWCFAGLLLVLLRGPYP
jgi:hypothetical protein